MQTSTRGIIIREQTVGESDRLVTILTSEFGIVKAFVRRAKSVKSKNMSATSLFAYSEFTLYRSKDAFVADNAKAIEIFFPLRQNIERLSLAQYFAQLALELAGEEQPADEMLRLILNAFHLLCAGEKSPKLIKAAFELRILCLGGYMPSLVACAQCSNYSAERMFFDFDSASIYCCSCAVPQGAIPVSSGVLSAMRFICFSDLKKIFSFSLSEENLKALGEITEKFLLFCCKCRFTTLEFYKGLT